MGRPPAAASRPAPTAIRVLPLVAAPLVLVADVASKSAVLSALQPGDAVRIIGDVVRLRLGFNSGVAFGLLTDGGGVLVWLTGLIGLALIAWLLTSVRNGAGWRRTLPLGLIIGGAFGNVADRVPDGLVTDVIDIGLGAVRWPAFNLADAAIVVGVAGIILLAPASRSLERPREPTGQETWPGHSQATERHGPEPRLQSRQAPPHRREFARPPADALPSRREGSRRRQLKRGETSDGTPDSTDPRS